MSQNRNHPTADRLHAFVEESLDEARRSAVESHLSVCDACRTEVAELEAVFGALAGLEQFAPSPGFADRVMTRVRVPSRAFADAEAWVRRLVPQSTRGWAVAAALLALPVVGATLLTAWIMSQPGVTPQGLWTMGTALAAEGLASGWQWTWTRLAGTNLVAWLERANELLATVGRGEIGLAAVMFATLTAGSIYVLYQNLFRTEARRTEHATYVF